MNPRFSVLINYKDIEGWDNTFFHFIGYEYKGEPHISKKCVHVKNMESPKMGKAVYVELECWKCGYKSCGVLFVGEDGEREVVRGLDGVKNQDHHFVVEAMCMFDGIVSFHGEARDGAIEIVVEIYEENKEVFGDLKTILRTVTTERNINMILKSLETKLYAGKQQGQANTVYSE